VQEGIIEDDSFLPIVIGADKEKDDWEDPEVWKKVNISLGQIFDFDKIERDFKKAKANPASAHNFKRFRLNLWVNNITAWLDMDDWDKCNEPVDYNELKRRRCYGAIDLSSKVDMSSFVLVFPPTKQGEKIKILPFYYMPEDTLAKRAKEDKVDYVRWKN